MSKTKHLGSSLAIVMALLAVSGCADMKDQHKLEPYEASAFFDDGRASRSLVEGTVPRGHLRDDDRIYRGLEADGHFVKSVPLEVDTELLARGRERYDIYCAPCHSSLGDGMGMIVQRGYQQPTSYHVDRLRQVEDGYIYDVITNGFGKMSSYAVQVKPMDRWAIVAYIRALQHSNMASAEGLPSLVRESLEAHGAFDPRVESHEGDDHGSTH